MTEPHDAPRGFCVSCDAIGRYEVGRCGEPAHLRWFRGEQEIGREEWPYGSNASICPPCWKAVKDARDERDRAWAEKHRASGGAAMKIVVVSRKPKKARRKTGKQAKQGQKSYRNGAVSKQER